MEKFIAVVFDSEEAAYKGADALRDLHKDGELAVYAAGVISKDTDGNVELRKSADEGPIGTAFGLMMGAVVGVLAGPVAVASGAAIAGSAAAASAAAGGMALGSITGGLFGAYRDLWVSGMDAVMLDNVSTELLPGKSCVLASVDEVWTTPLDTKMGELGGRIFRKLRVDAIDEEMAAEMDALRRLQAKKPTGPLRWLAETTFYCSVSTAPKTTSTTNHGSLGIWNKRSDHKPTGHLVGCRLHCLGRTSDA